MREGGTSLEARRRCIQAVEPVLRRARSPLARAGAAFAAAAIALGLALSLAGCDGSGGSEPSSDAGQTSGPAFQRPSLALSPFDGQAATVENGASIDASHLAEGYVAASASSSARLKFEVAGNGTSYYFDLPSDGTPISCPLVAGDGPYTFTVWENTSGQRYAELLTVAQDVALADEFQPFVRPNVFCDYDANSESAKLADRLCADAQNEGDVVKAVYDWIVDSIAYDEGKAASLADATGYLPDPDATIADGSGICFDYASLAAAMLRSQGIPCKIVTGYVSPDNIYHAWNMVYIDGTWVSAGIDIEQGTWTRIDTTFAAGGDMSFVGDGATYTDRYTY